MDFLNALVVFSNFVFIPALAYGSQLALGALGVTLIYGILRFSNFAHGDTMAFGAMITVLGTWWLQSIGVGLGPLPTALIALPIGIIFCSLFILATDRFVYRFYRNQKAKPVILVIVSMGIMFIMNGLVRFIIGPNDQRFLFIPDNEDLALLSGINPEKVVTVTWLIVAALATVAGTLYGLDKSFKPFVYFSLLLPIFASAIVGGLGNPIGAIAGGFIVAFSEVTITYAWKKVLKYSLPESLEPTTLMQLLSTDYKFAVSFVILVVVLLFRPTGLFRGKAF